MDIEGFGSAKVEICVLSVIHFNGCILGSMCITLHSYLLSLKVTMSIAAMCVL